MASKVKKGVVRAWTDKDLDTHGSWIVRTKGWFGTPRYGDVPVLLVDPRKYDVVPKKPAKKKRKVK